MPRGTAIITAESDRSFGHAVCTWLAEAARFEPLVFGSRHSAVRVLNFKVDFTLERVPEMATSPSGPLSTTFVRTVVSAIAFATALAHPAPAQGVLRTMDWLDTADAGRMIEAAIRAKRFELLSVCGFECRPPHIDLAQYRHCYSRAANLRVIDATGDVVDSERHMRLKTRAAALASEYNRLLLTVLDSLGMRACPRGEDWDALHLALARLADSIPRRPRWSSVRNPEPYEKADFQFHVPDEAEVGSALFAHICRLPPTFGIARMVHVVVTSGDNPLNPTRRRPLACRGGRKA